MATEWGATDVRKLMYLCRKKMSSILSLAVVSASFELHNTSLLQTDTTKESSILTTKRQNFTIATVPEMSTGTIQRVDIVKRVSWIFCCYYGWH